jgi:hypothetical protein
VTGRVLSGSGPDVDSWGSLLCPAHPSNVPAMCTSLLGRRSVLKCTEVCVQRQVPLRAFLHLCLLLHSIWDRGNMAPEQSRNPCLPTNWPLPPIYLLQAGGWGQGEMQWAPCHSAHEAGLSPSKQLSPPPCRHLETMNLRGESKPRAGWWGAGNF